jgi:hypothetical protein
MQRRQFLGNIWSLIALGTVPGCGSQSAGIPGARSGAESTKSASEIRKDFDAAFEKTVRDYPAESSSSR